MNYHRKFPLSGKIFCLHFTKSASQRETLPVVSGITFLHVNRTNTACVTNWRMFSRDNIMFKQIVLNLNFRLLNAISLEFFSIEFKSTPLFCK